MSLIIFSAQMSDLSIAAKMGELAMNLCFRTRSMLHMVEFVPSYFMILLTSKRFQEAAALLTKFHSHAIYSKDARSLTWYFALAMDFLLDTGNEIEPFEACKSFCHREVITKKRTFVDKCQVRLAVNLLTFRSRMKNRGELHNEEFDEIEKILQSEKFDMDKSHSLDEIFSLLRLYELNRNQTEIAKSVEYFPDFLKVQFQWLQIICADEKLNVPSTKTLENLKSEAIRHHNHLCHDEIQNYQILFKEHAV